MKTGGSSPGSLAQVDRRTVETFLNTFVALCVAAVRMSSDCLFVKALTVLEDTAYVGTVIVGQLLDAFILFLLL